MNRWCKTILVTVMLLCLSGASLALLQTAAWTGMLASRAPTQGIAASVKTTFDGKHPCPLCKVVDAGRKPEKKNDVQLKIPRIEFPHEPSCVHLIATEHETITVANEYSESISSHPRLRPPSLLM